MVRDVPCCSSRRRRRLRLRVIIRRVRVQLSLRHFRAPGWCSRAAPPAPPRTLGDNLYRYKSTGGALSLPPSPLSLPPPLSQTSFFGRFENCKSLEDARRPAARAIADHPDVTQCGKSQGVPYIKTEASPTSRSSTARATMGDNLHHTGTESSSSTWTPLHCRRWRCARGGRWRGFSCGGAAGFE